MPIVYRDRIRSEPLLGTEVPASRAEVLTETFAQAFEENPINIPGVSTSAASRFFALREDQRTGPRMDAGTARQKLKDAGLEKHLTINDAGITQAALDTLMERKRTELRRQEIFARSQGGLGEFSQRLGLSIATTLADPISMAANFIPVVGQARYARWLGKAGSFAARAGVRAGVGAAEGAVGAALLEPLVYGMRTQEQADYETADSLMNVALGGVTGAGLHASIGSVAEGYDVLRQNIGWPAAIPRAAGLSREDRLIEYRLGKQIASDIDKAIAKYAMLDGAEGGKLLNTDLARELSPEYRADRTQSAAVHEPASWLVKRMYERKLAESPKEGEDALVVFSAGGTGAGKSTGLAALASSDPRVARAQIIYDTNFNKLKSAVDKIEQALAAGKRVEILYTWRDPVDALKNGSLPRAMRMGRTVPLDEHLNTHLGSAEVIQQLATKYADDERVGVTVFDNSHGRGKARFGQISAIPKLEYNAVREDLRATLEAERASGAISEAVYRGSSERRPAYATGTRASGSGQPQSSDGRQALSADERAALASPAVREAALRAAVGQAVEGQPINVEPIFASQELSAEDFVRTVMRQEPPPSDIRASQAAEEQIAEAPDLGTSEGHLQAAEEEAQLAVADAKAVMQRLGLEYVEDPDLAEGLAKAERWARVAELATVCLVRGD